MSDISFYQEFDFLEYRRASICMALAVRVRSRLSNNHGDASGL